MEVCEGRWEVVGFGFNGYGQLNFPKKLSAVSQLQAAQPAPLELTVTARVLVQLPSPSLQVKVSSAWDSLHLFVETAETTVSVATGRWLQPLRGVERSLGDGEVVAEVVETQGGHFILRTSLERNLVAWDDSSSVIKVEELTPRTISKLVSLEGGQILSLLSSGKVHHCSITPLSSCNLLGPEVPLGRHIVSRMSCGYNHTLLLTQDGAVLSFGVGSRGQLGLGDVLPRAEPQLVPGLAGLPVAAVACGGWHSLALSVCGDVYSWGWNRDGQLGLGEGAVQTVAQPSLVVIGGSSGVGVSGVSGSGVGENSEGASGVGGAGAGVSGVGASGESVSSDGGCGDSGRGEGEDVTVISISCGSRHSAVLTEPGVLHCWGWNGYGQLGSRAGIRGSRWTTVHCAHWNTLLVT